jgi:hypothetical protein
MLVKPNEALCASTPLFRLIRRDQPAIRAKQGEAARIDARAIFDQEFSDLQR